MNTPYLGTPLSGENYQTSLGTTVLSDLSVSGTIETGVLEVAGGSALNVLTSVTQLTAILTVPAGQSLDTTFTLTGASTTGPQQVVVGAPSSLSADQAYNAFVSAADVGTLRLTNASALTAVVQTAQTWRFTLVDFA